MLKAPDNAGGKKCQCTKCGELVVIPGGKQAPMKPTEPTSRPASIATELDDIIVRQQEQILEIAAERTRRNQAAERRAIQQQDVFQGHYAGRDYSNPKSSASGGISKTVTTVVASISGIVLVLSIVCGLGMFLAYGRTTELKVGAYRVLPRGQGTTQNANVDSTRGQGVLNRFTGSEFWIYTTPVPDDPGVQREVMERFGSNSSDSFAVQRDSLSGNRFNNVSSAALKMKTNLRCSMEVFVDKGTLVVTCYIPGSEKERVGMQKHSRSKSMEEYFDKPESFFSSLQKE